MTQAFTLIALGLGMAALAGIAQAEARAKFMVRVWSAGVLSVILGLALLLNLIGLSQ